MLDWIKYFFSWGHLFSSYAPKFQDSTYSILMYSLSAMIVLGIIFKIVAALQKMVPWKTLYNRIGGWLITISVLSLVSVFFTQTATPLLGSRFWFVLWMIIALVWLYYICKFAFTKLPKQVEEMHEQQQRAKYLPKKV